MLPCGHSMCSNCIFNSFESKGVYQCNIVLSKVVHVCRVLTPWSVTLLPPTCCSSKWSKEYSNWFVKNNGSKEAWNKINNLFSLARFSYEFNSNAFIHFAKEGSLKGMGYLNSTALKNARRTMRSLNKLHEINIFIFILVIKFVM